MSADEIDDYLQGVEEPKRIVEPTERGYTLTREGRKLLEFHPELDAWANFKRGRRLRRVPRPVGAGRRQCVRIGRLPAGTRWLGPARDPPLGPDLLSGSDKAVAQASSNTCRATRWA